MDPGCQKQTKNIPPPQKKKQGKGEEEKEEEEKQKEKEVEDEAEEKEEEEEEEASRVSPLASHWLGVGSGGGSLLKSVCLIQCHLLVLSR